MRHQGGGKLRPYPVTKRFAEPYRVRAGLAPALVNMGYSHFLMFIVLAWLNMLTKDVTIAVEILAFIDRSDNKREVR